ncbi:hypothetical protein CERZMDRAFT_89280 [Cercospora zeae-maydis SCOH1-5]|uniref:Uncharacterized protein n=1 Tax=Cercospora zeae-maydis SCOH1-5 TaxID=717836 RepID=A0A6A6F2B0_9PEZI|nr:hypothetical protein CERZMDRAFT_89280 [Cercospora zeae-maydis SCOH1-5]
MLKHPLAFACKVMHEHQSPRGTPYVSARAVDLSSSLPYMLVNHALSSQTDAQQPTQIFYYDQTTQNLRNDRFSSDASFHSSSNHPGNAFINDEISMYLACCHAPISSYLEKKTAPMASHQLPRNTLV